MTTDETTESTTSEPEAPRRRSIRSGATALILSIILVLWVVLWAWLGIIGIGNDAALVIATIIGFASILVIPGLAIAILVLAIIALLFNPVPGKVLGALGIVLPVITAAVFWGQIGGFATNSFF